MTQEKSLQQQSNELTGNRGEKDRVNTREPKALAIQTPSPIVATTPRSIFTMTNDQVQRLKTVAQMVSASQLAFGRGLKEGDAFLIMLKGIEVGLEPMAAIDSFDVIQGKPTLSPQGMLALIYRTDELSTLDVTGDATQCRVTMKRGSIVHTEVFTMADAEALNLAGKDNWKKQPAVMLKWRAVSACCRIVFPDVIQGLYTQEEFGANVEYTDDGSVIVETTALPEPTEAPAETPTPTPTPETKSVDTTPKTDTPPQLIRSRLVDFIAFMYPDDEGEFHRNGTIKAMFEDGSLTDQTSYFEATRLILLRRAFKKYMMDESMVIKAMGISVEDESIGDFGVWHKRFSDPKEAWEAAWQAVVDYHENAKREPAQPKNGESAPAEPEPTIPF